MLASIVIAALALAPGQATDSHKAARRVVAATSLAAKEYALGVAEGGGRIVQLEEVEEARLFILNARRDVGLLPAAVRAHADSGLVELAALVDDLAPPAEVERRADALTRAIAAAVGGGLDPTPGRPPSLARGRSVYVDRCVTCHGEGGRGDGPKAASVVGPPPGDLTDTTRGGERTVVEIFQRVSIGVPGTGMSSFDGVIGEEDRWAVAAYVAALQFGGSMTAATFAAVRRQIDTAVAHRSDRDALEAYLTFEQVEADLRVRDAALARVLEADFATLRTRATTATPLALDSVRDRLRAGLERAERKVSDHASPAGLFVQSFLLLVREGFEAILILAALLTFLTKAGAPERRRDVTRGAVWAVVASLVTWALVEWVFEIGAPQRETLEGATMLLAAGVLFFVSYWLLSKVEAAKWMAFVRDRMQGALASGSGLALVSVAFLAVYREGLETILFYKALFASGGAAVSTAAILLGLAAAAVVLVALYVAINRFGLRIPTRPFFALTSAVLYYMAFVFAGKGVAELQEAGVLGLSPVAWAPRVPALGIYPTVQSLALQGLLALAAIVAVAWVTLPRLGAAVRRGDS